MFRRPDDAIASAALLGDARALDALIAGWLPQVCAWCARLGAHDTDEAALDVMMTLVRRRASIDGPGHLPPWLFAACRGVVANQRKRVWWRRWVPGARVDAASGPGPDVAAEDREVARRVGAVLERLEPVHREVLVLCYFEDRGVDEAAALLGVPAGTVKSRLFNARRRFDEAYGGRDV